MNFGLNSTNTSNFISINMKVNCIIDIKVGIVYLTYNPDAL